MELQSVVEKRQSIRRYKDGEVKNADLIEMARAASLAPSGKNIQNWHFVAVKDDKVKARVGEVILAENERIAARMDTVDVEKAARFRKFCRNFTMFAVGAPALVVVFSEKYVPSGYNELLSVGADEACLSELIDRRSPGMQSLGAAIENFTLKAIDLGYGSCWLTSANYAAEGIEKLFAHEGIFDCGEGFMAALLAVGIPEDNQKSPVKKPVGEILTIVE